MTRRGDEKTNQSGAAKEAILHFRRLSHTAKGALLEVRLETGRKHQIRVQLSHMGYPIKGDRKYGSRTFLDAGIALHARSLSLNHPTTKERLTFTANPPAFWKELGVQ